MKRFFLFVALLLTAFAAFAGDPVFFVQLTDTHFGTDDNAQRALAAVKAINALPMQIAFAAVTGDIVNDGMIASNEVNEALTVLGGLKCPVYFVPGNHDLLKKSPEETVTVFTNRFGPLISSVQYGGVDFIFVCTEPLAGGVQIKGYDPLEELAAMLTDRPAVIFHHIPSLDNFNNNRMRAGWGRSDAGQRWTNLLNQRNVKAVIAGHFHRDELGWTGRVPLYVGPPLSGRLGRQAAFRIYEYQDGRLSYRTQYLE